MQSSCVVVLIQSKQVNFMLKVQNESGLNQKCLTKKILHKWGNSRIASWGRKSRQTHRSTSRRFPGQTRVDFFF